MVKSSCACALTCKEARENGVRRETGECVMTKMAYKVPGFEYAPLPLYTQCKGCQRRVCIPCWESMADKYDEIVRDRSIVPHDVWHGDGNDATIEGTLL